MEREKKHNVYILRVNNVHTASSWGVCLHVCVRVHIRQALDCNGLAVQLFFFYYGHLFAICDMLGQLLWPDGDAKSTFP